MGIEIKASFFPYRLILSHHEPVQLSIDVKNNTPIMKLLSLELSPEQTLAFDKAGLKRKIIEKMGEVKAEETRRFSFQVFPRSIVKEGEYPMDINVREHHQDYSHTIVKTTHHLALKVSK